jgi:SAM-dependent methyltransferase
MTWWQAYFGSDDYLLLEGAPEPAQVERVAMCICSVLGLRPGSRVLDVGCGMGRHAMALVRRGCLVTAVDASDYMIAHCRQQAAVEPRLIVAQGDYHDLPYEAEFDAVVCLGNTIGYGTREDDAVAIRRMLAALVPGGSLLLELHNKAWYVESVVGRTWWEEETAFVLSDVTLDPAGQRLMTRDVVIPKDGSPPREYGMSLLQYGPDEIVEMLASAGLVDVAFLGDAGTDDDGPPWSREGYGDESRAMVVTARKP